MAEIRTPVEGFTGVSAGVSFTDGVGHTDDVAALAYFRGAGYEVVEDDEPEVEIPEGDPSESWKVDQLKAYAADKGIDLGDATKKADILAVLTAEQPDS